MEPAKSVRSGLPWWAVFRNPRDVLYVTPLGTPPGGESTVPIDTQNLALGNATSSLMGAVGDVRPDQEGVLSVHGLASPYVHDALIGLTVTNLAAGLTRPGARPQPARQCP